MAFQPLIVLGGHRLMASAMNESLARQAFDRIFGAYELNDNDIAWRVFLAGWDSRAVITTEDDLIRLADSRYLQKGHLDA